MGTPAQVEAATGLADRYVRVRQMTEHLCVPLSAEDQMIQSMPEASPAKWHQAHTTWFFETFVLTPHFPGYKPFDSNFRFLFNSYYKQLASSGAAAHPVRGFRGTFSRPSLQEIQAYRKYIDEQVLEFLSRDPSPEVESLVELGTHHEQQHQELILTDIKHAFWVHPLRPAYHPAKIALAMEELPLEWVRFRGGVVEIGHDDDDFAFDNEMPVHDVVLEPYRLASRLVTNGDYLEFIDDGGYTDPALWLSDGWERVCAEGWRAPMYWEQSAGTWMEFTLAGMRELDLSAPVCHVSYYEADAFARWVGARLPREEEWEHAAKKLSVAARVAAANLLESGALHPVPASSADERVTTGDRPPMTSLFGDVWEWTASAYLGYPGYRAADGVLGEYNGKFMSGQMVLRGGSCATPESHIRATYRNFFPPHARWQFMGIRLANDGD